jgi:hypothetical protein
MTESPKVVLPAQDHPDRLELEGKRQTIRRDGVGSARDATKNDAADVGSPGDKVQ